MLDKLRYLLLQVRNQDDPMRVQEITCFARVLRCDPNRIRTLDLLKTAPTPRDLDGNDVVLLGGSGHYGVVNDSP